MNSPRARAMPSFAFPWIVGGSGDTYWGGLWKTTDYPRFFGTTEQFWMNPQSAYEVSLVKAEHAAEIERIQPRAAAASR